MNNNEEKDWKEFWRQNSPEYQRNKRNKQKKIINSIFMFAFIFIIFWIASNHNNLDSNSRTYNYTDNENVNVKYDHIVDNSNSNDSISYNDNLFIEKIKTLRELYDKDTLDFESINNNITSISDIEVSKIFKDLKIDASEELLLINPYNDKQEDVIVHKIKFNSYYSIFFEKFEQLLKDNNKKYIKQEDIITYYVNIY
nr:hypothetical protein [uncultured Lachnoclostridium sp.]